MSDRKMTSPLMAAEDKNRYYSLDKLKALCAFLVVCIHAPFPGVYGKYFVALTRVAVPVFFIISGFFWRPKKTKKQIIKLLKLMLIGNAIYLAFALIKTAVRGEISLYVAQTFTVVDCKMKLDT